MERSTVSPSNVIVDDIDTIVLDIGRSKCEISTNADNIRPVFPVFTILSRIYSGCLMFGRTDVAIGDGAYMGV